jgi:hypothetical protein
MPRKTAAQKRDLAAPPVVKTLTEPKGAAFPAGRMLIPSPLAIQTIVQKIPRGSLLPSAELRHKLALAHNADYACPVTTGILLRVVIDAATEEGRADVPWWRVLRDGGKLFDTIPGGAATQARLLEDEGHKVTTKGKSMVVLLQ